MKHTFNVGDVVQCTEVTGATRFLTLGKHYGVTGITTSYVKVTDDKGRENINVMPERFILTAAGPDPIYKPLLQDELDLDTDAGPESTTDLRQYRYTPEVF
jgi:hypothetical protein